MSWGPCIHQVGPVAKDGIHTYKARFMDSDDLWPREPPYKPWRDEPIITVCGKLGVVEKRREFKRIVNKE